MSPDKKNLREAKRVSHRIIPEVGLPHWDHSSEILKMLGWSMASRELGATPFTLRLSDDVVIKAQACRRGFGWYMQDRLNRCLRPVMAHHSLNGMDAHPVCSRDGWTRSRRETQRTSPWRKNLARLACCTSHGCGAVHDHARNESSASGCWGQSSHRHGAAG